MRMDHRLMYQMLVCLLVALFVEVWGGAAFLENVTELNFEVLWLVPTFSPIFLLCVCSKMYDF